MRNKELKRYFDVSVVIYGVWKYDKIIVLIIEIDIEFTYLISIFYIKIYEEKELYFINKKLKYLKRFLEY